VVVATLGDSGAEQLTLPFDRHRGTALDQVRARFGNDASPEPCCSAAIRACRSRYSPTDPVAWPKYELVFE
jgi:hypothetical protein